MGYRVTSKATQSVEVARAKAQQAIRDLRGRIERLDVDAIDLILREARNHYKWADREVPRALLEDIYQIRLARADQYELLPGAIRFRDIAKRQR